MTLTEDMALEAKRLVNLLEDPHPDLATWQQAVNETMSRLADLYFKKPEGETQMQPKPTSKDGPNFISRMRHFHVEIILNNGDSMRGKILRFNRYELLFQEAVTADLPPIVLMKHAIRYIKPIGENPFTEKKEEDAVKVVSATPQVRTEG